MSSTAIEMWSIPGRRFLLVDLAELDLGGTLPADAVVVVPADPELPGEVEAEHLLVEPARGFDVDDVHRDVKNVPVFSPAAPGKEVRHPVRVAFGSAAGWRSRGPGLDAGAPTDYSSSPNRS